MVIVVAGVSGAGKTSVGAALAERLDLAFLDADDLHPRENVERMRAGEPLDESAREQWLARVIDALRRPPESKVVACSALRRAHRDRLRSTVHDVRVVVLTAPRQVLEGRIDRDDHFFPAELLGSQLRTFEAPRPREDAVVVEATGSVEETVAEILRRLPTPG